MEVDEYGSGGASEGDIRGNSSDLIDSVSGVVDLAGGDLAVVQSGTPGMSVLVGKGVGYIPNDSFDDEDSDSIKFWEAVVYGTTGSRTLAIDSNSSGQVRIDLACLKIDPGTAPDKDASNVATLIIVKGTPGAGAPATPAYYMVLARVTVANGATEILNANIADYRTQIVLKAEVLPTIIPDELDDSNGILAVSIVAAATPVNYWTMKNSPANTNVILGVAGASTNIGMDIKVKGTGRVRKPTVIGIQVMDVNSNTGIGDGKAFFRIPEELNGMNLTGVNASVFTAGTTNTTDIQIRNKTDSQDMLSTKITIDSTETDTSTAATPAVIDGAHDDVVTGDIIEIDIDAISTTPAKGLFVELRFELP
jgi:hypothetical protein